MAINGLMTRRSFIVTEAPETLADDLAAIDRALVLLGFTDDPSVFMPRQRNRRIFRKGEMLRLIRGVLRDATEPMSSREICLAILPDTFDMSDKRRVNQLRRGFIRSFVSRPKLGGLFGLRVGLLGGLCGLARVRVAKQSGKAIDR